MLLHNPPGDHPLALVLWNAAQRMGSEFDRRLESVGGNRYWFFILEVLGAQPSAAQHTIAEALGVDTATLTHHLSQMQDQDLIAKHKHPDDRRRVVVEVLPRGAHLHRSMLRAVDEYNRDQFAGMSTDEVRTLTALIARMDRNSRAMAKRDVPPRAD